MACESWIGKLDAYFDGELPADEARALGEHLRQCPTCATEALSKLQQKLAVRDAGHRFVPDPIFRARIKKSIAARGPSPWKRLWMPVLATATALLFAVVFLLSFNRGQRDEQQLMSELVDLHVATLASSNPIDVVSSDRHTVKPWFEGKIPFTFNLPELQNSPFTLVGGRVSYLNQSPGAELIFRVRQHQISVFIFQDQGLKQIRGDETVRTTLSFDIRSWRHKGLHYFVIGDASAEDLDKLSELLKSAG